MAKHHYVPVFYLRKFCDPRYPALQEPYLWVGKRSEPGWKKRAPKNVAFKTGLYSIHGDDVSDPEFVEKTFNLIETDMAGLYRTRLDFAELPRDRKERSILAHFVGLFVIRSPFYRGLLASMMEQTAAMHRKVLGGTPGALESAVHRIEAETGKGFGMPLQDFRRALLDERLKLKANPEVVTALALQQWEQISWILFCMRWRLLVASSGTHFISSDSPAFWQDPTPRPPFLAGHGLMMKNIEVVLPLSRNLCFLARWGRATGIYAATSWQMIELINRTVAWSTDEVYSPAPFPRSNIGKPAQRLLYDEWLSGPPRHRTAS